MDLFNRAWQASALANNIPLDHSDDAEDGRGMFYLGALAFNDVLFELVERGDLAAINAMVCEIGEYLQIRGATRLGRQTVKKVAGE